MTNEKRENFYPLSVQDIASWQDKRTAAGKVPCVIAEIPSLQRGAIWNAGQVELLWDSIMRGFPIGAFVICKKLESQTKQFGNNGSGWLSNEVKFHLLDGQQRCNAISLGFLNPCADEIDRKDRRAYLWIDLQPEMLPSGSTRQFLFRVLTTAHPWGYKTNDNADPLGVEKIHDALEKYGEENEDGRRLRPKFLFKAWPQESKIPIPFSWLIRAAILNSLNEKHLWEDVLRECEDIKGRTWADKAAELIRAHLNNAKNEKLVLIEKGLGYAKSISVVALEVPPEILTEVSIQERNANTEEQGADDRISIVEHLFQRLNSGGTELRGEELAFSMIKAYWPRIEESFGAIKDKNESPQQPMSGSSLAMLSARAALIGDGKKERQTKLPAPLSISRIRSVSYDAKAKAEKDLLEQYLGINIGRIDFSSSDLHLNLLQIDQWLLHNGEEGDFGLPPVLRTSLAQNAPDVFLLLLHIAQKTRNEKLGAEQISALRKRLLGLSTALYWFGGKHRADTIDGIYSKTFSSDKLTPEIFNSALRYINEPQNNRRGILKILTPSALEELISKPNSMDENLKDWSFWGEIVNKSQPEQKQNRANHEWPIIDRIKKSKDLLLFAQREFMCSRFKEYDPSRADTWKESNRPWDFDHILPSATLHDKRGKILKIACDEWVNTIGNFRAWPLEENRSKSDRTDSIEQKDFKNSFIHDQAECEAFSMSKIEIDIPEKAAAFMNAARTRMIRIYSDWFDSLEIGELL